MYKSPWFTPQDINPPASGKSLQPYVVGNRCFAASAREVYMTMTKLFYRFSKLHKLSDFFNVFFVASHVVCFSFRIYAERFNNRYCFGYVIRPKPTGQDNRNAHRFDYPFRCSNHASLPSLPLEYHLFSAYQEADSQQLHYTA